MSCLCERKHLSSRELLTKKQLNKINLLHKQTNVEKLNCPVCKPCPQTCSKHFLTSCGGLKAEQVVFRNDVPGGLSRFDVSVLSPFLLVCSCLVHLLYQQICALYPAMSCLSCSSCYGQVE